MPIFTARRPILWGFEDEAAGKSPPLPQISADCRRSALHEAARASSSYTNGAND